MKRRIPGLDRVNFLLAATEQLDAAISLAEQAKYIPAITLASAAEEVCGKRLGSRSILNQFIAELSQRVGPKIALKELTGAKNLLKHWDPASNPDEVTLFLEFESMMAITRATSNVHTYLGQDRAPDALVPPDEAEQVKRVCGLLIAFLERNNEWIRSAVAEYAAGAPSDDQELGAAGILSTLINKD
jgi:hypothetical protein